MRGLAPTLSILLLATSLGASARLAAEVTLPPRPARYVTDRTGRLEAARLSALNDKLAAFERETSTQVVLYVDSRMPPGTTLEELAHRMFQRWTIGQKGKDNGALFLAFLDDRVMRLEVGYGLEGAIPDARARRITGEAVRPRFARGDLTGGIEAAAAEILAAARGEPFQGTGRTVAETKPSPEAPPLLPFSALQIAGALGLLFGGLAPFGLKRATVGSKLAHGVAIGAFCSGLWLLVSHLLTGQASQFRVAASLLGVAALVTAVKVVAQARLRSAAHGSAAAHWTCALARLSWLAGALVLVWTVSGRGPSGWVPVALLQAGLALHGLGRALEARGGGRVRAILSTLGFVLAAGVAFGAYRGFAVGEVPFAELATLFGALLFSGIVRAGALHGQAPAAARPSWSSGSDGHSSRSRSSSSVPAGSAPRPSSSSFSGGGGRSGGGGASDSW